MSNEDIVLPTEYEYCDEDVVLDPYNSDLNLIIDKDCLLAYPLSNEGFAMMWAGCRATYGVSCGRAAFELTDYCESEDIPKDDQESYALRLGWSVNTCSMQLGENVLSYAYCSNGKKLNKSVFEEYGEPFVKSDSIAAYVDYETDPDNLIISFSKNGIDLGTAFTVAKSEILQEIRQFNNNNDEEIVFFPHILTKNVVFEVNYGQRVSLLGDEPFAPIKPSYELMQKLPLDKRVKGEIAPKDKQDCEVIMLVGLPGSGKTYWITEFCKKNPKKRYNVLGVTTMLDKMKTYDHKKRSLSSNNVGNQSNSNISALAKSNAEFYEKASKCMNKLIEFASQLNRNVILDQHNVFGSARRRKMKLFEGFKRKAVVIVPNDETYKERIKKAETEEGKEFPISMILNMKTSFTLPKVDEIFDSVEYAELDEINSRTIVEKYNVDGPAMRLQMILDKRSKLNDENRATATSVRLFRAGYGYGKDTRFNRGPYQPYRRPQIQSQMNRFGAPSFTVPTIRSALPYGYAVAPGWNPLNATIQQPWSVQNYSQPQNDWMPALPIHPFQIPQQTQIAWQQPWNTIQAQQQQQQQQQAIQQSQTYNNWTPAMATNVTNIASSQNTFLNNNNNK